MEILQNQKSINQCKDNQNTESTSNSGTFHMEQLRKEIESQIKQEMQNQTVDMRLRQVENQMMQFMCLNTTITTQMMVHSQNSCSHMVNLHNPEDHPIGNLQQMWNKQQNLNQQHQMNQQVRTQLQSNHQYHQPDSSQQHPNEPTYVSNQYRWQNQSEDEDQTMRQSNVRSQYQGLNQREDEDQTMSQGNVRSQYRWQNQRGDEDQTIRQSNVRSQYHKPCYSGSNITHHSQVNSKRRGNHYRTYNRTILPTPSQDQQGRYPRQNHPISRQQEDQGHYLNAQNHHPQRWHPDQQMQNMEHTTQTSTIQVRQDQPMRKQTYKTPLTKQDINENRQSISAPPYRTGMLIGDISRQHYSRERTQAGHRSYEGNNTGKLQQNMTLESSTNDFREKEENQTSHTGVELNNYFLERTGLQRKPPDHFQKEIEQDLDKNQRQC
jgi:hypothetical protein